MCIFEVLRFTTGRASCWSKKCPRKMESHFGKSAHDTSFWRTLQLCDVDDVYVETLPKALRSQALTALAKSTIEKSCSLSLRLVTSFTSHKRFSHRSDCRRRNFGQTSALFGLTMREQYLAIN